VSGADVSTWSERFIADSRGFELVLDDSPSAAEYVIRSGVVLAGAVRAGDIGDVTGLAASTGTAEASTAEASTAEASTAEADAAASIPVVVVPSVPAVPVEPDPQPLVTEPAPSTAELPATEPIDEVSGEEPAEPVAPEAAQSHHTLLPSEFTYAPDPATDEQPAPEDEPEDDEAPSLADLFPEATVQVAPVAPAPPVPPVSTDIGDHDGATISLAEARRLRAESAGPDAPTAVLPVMEQPAGANGRVRVSSGQVIELDRTVIIGRRPRATRASGTSLPHLVAVESPQQDISRSHLEVRPEGDSVVVIDLHTTNGSTLLRPGSDPMRLHPGEHTLVLDGDVVDLGDGITVAFEGLA
jgi:hypothetical protein